MLSRLILLWKYSPNSWADRYVDCTWMEITIILDLFLIMRQLASCAYYVFRCGKCQSCGLASWNVSLKQGHILFRFCCRYYYISWKWRISPCFSLLFCSFSNCSFSFYTCLQLPPPQLESALNKHANLRGPLATYASQPSTKTSLPRYNSKGPNLSPSLIRESSRLLFHSAVIFFSLPFVMLLFYWIKKFMISQVKWAS